MKRMKPGFSFLPHTADMRMRVAGRTLKGLFENAAKGLSELLTGKHGPGRESILKIRIKAVDPETLLVSWLNELNYRCIEKHASIERTAISEITPHSVDAEIMLRTGAKINREIKAFTYHKLAINRTKNGYKTEIVFDI
ncbi:MAG: archease [Elusimicrobiota bacterium]